MSFFNHGKGYNLHLSFVIDVESESCRCEQQPAMGMGARYAENPSTEKKTSKPAHQRMWAGVAVQRLR